MWIGQTGHELAPFGRQGFVEALLPRRQQAVQYALGSVFPPCFLIQALSRRLYQLSILPADVQGQGAGSSQGRISLGQFFCVADGCCQQIAIDNTIDQFHARGLVGAERIARGDEFNRCRYASKTWRALGAAGAWQKSQFDLGQAHFRGVNGQSVVAG